MDYVQDINKALEYTQKGDLINAKKIYKSIIKSDKENFLALSCFGLFCLNTHDLKNAEKYLTKAYHIKETKTVCEGLALTYYGMNKYLTADKYFKKFIDKSQNYELQIKYADNLFKLSNFHKGYEYSKKLYQKYPLQKEAVVNYAKMCVYTGSFHEAERVLATAVKQFPKYGETWAVMGLIYEMYYKDFILAKDCFQKELKFGDKYDAYFNLTVISERLGDYKKTMYYLKKMSKYLGKYDHTTAFIRASIYFKQRKFKQALKQYIYRGWSNNKKITKLKHCWDGKKYKNETLFVLGDNGIGDIIMYCRYLPFLVNKFKKIKVFIRSDVRGLVKRFCKDYKNIIFVKKTKQYPKYDKSVPLSDLPYYLKMPYDNIPYSKGYLSVNKEKIGQYSQYFDNKKLKIGICWEAGTIGFRDLIHRTLNVSMFEPLFSIPNAQFYSLQVNPTMDNYKNYNLIDLGSKFEDCDDTLEAINNLNLVISVDTSVAHLAGALGVKTFLILPFCADWRWFDNNKNTEWYDSVQIFKQTNPKTWNDVFEKIKKEL